MGAVEARLFAREGASVGIADILEDEGRRLEAEIAEAGGQASFIKLDVTSEDDWQRAVESIVRSYGKLDALVNNAGIFHLATVEDTTVEDWDQILSVNGKGVFLGTKAAIPEMRRAGGGSIVNISSIAGLIGSRGAAAYGASKGAVRLLTKSTAIQYAADNIRCNSVHPGLVDTDMLRLVFPDDTAYQNSSSRVPLGRLATAEDIANGVLFLASDESSYMTGSELVIDGGVTAQ